MPNSPGTSLTVDVTLALVTSLLGPANGETIEDDDVTDPFQKLLNGLHRVGRFNLSDPADLPTTVATPRDGERFHVRTKGLYEYRSASGATPDGLFVINGPGGVGRFHHLLDGFTNVAGGLARYPIANRVISVSGNSFSTADTTASTSYVDASHHVLSLGSLNVGDIVLGFADIAQFISTSPHLGFVSLYSRENGSVYSATSLPYATDDQGGGAKNSGRRSSHSLIVVVSNAGAFDLVVRHKVDDPANTNTLSESRIRALVIRPS